MVVGEPSIHNIMGGMESTGGVRLHNHKRKLKQRFDIIKKLGQGTYGKVQLGINKETGQEVAIKTIKKCKIETEADLIRIRREIQIMSSVQHPNIIHIYEVFENKEKMVLVMEYAAGGELYDYLSERKVLSEEEARRIFRQISIAVYYCHKHKICHRDLKLENILLDQIGNAKIADFGLSNVFDEQRLLNTFCGSPLYASPEIVKGTPYHGPEVDCWSLGVLLYTLVYGAMPFDGSNFKRLTRQISQSDYFEPKNPSPASPLIKDMLTKCPARRSDIEKICSHWWVNEGYEQNCLDIAEDLAAQTPVRLDLLLSLVPQSASADKLVVGDERQAGEVATVAPSEAVAPTRCHSVGSLMELECNNSDRRVQEMVDQETTRTPAAVDSKRKLETTPSMEETADLEAGVKRKERLRKKDKNDETRPHRFTSNRHHSAPISQSITEEAMEIDPNGESGTMKPLLDLRNDETASACLELIKESLSKSPSKERSKTPLGPVEQAPATSSTGTTTAGEKIDDVNENVNEVKPMSDKMAGVEDVSPEPTGREITEETATKKIVEESPTPRRKDAEAVKSTTNAETPNQDEPRESIKADSNEVAGKKESDKTEAPPGVKEAKKLRQKAASLDSEMSNEAAISPGKPTERRRSKIFETAEKFNQLAAGIESDKPRKIFIPGVNVGGAKRAFERKASLTSVVSPQPVKQSSSKVIIDVPNERKSDKVEEKSNDVAKVAREADEDVVKREVEKKRAVDIITGAIGKPPVQRKLNGSPPVTPQSPESKKLGLKIQVGPNDVRTATVSVSTPVETKFPFETKPAALETSVPNSPESQSLESSYTDEPTVSSKMEITLKSATLPRQRKTSKAEITLSGAKSSSAGGAFKSEVEAKIDAFHPQKLRTQRSEVAFPVAAVVPQSNRSSSLEPETAAKIPPKERIIPIQVESDHQQQRRTSTPPPKPPMPQRSMSQRSGSLSRQSTADSDTDSALGSTTTTTTTAGPEPIRKSPREYIIPIAVEGGGYVTPRSGSVEPESKTSTPTSTNPPRSRFGRPRRMSSLLSDASEDESPFSTLHRDSDDLLQRHMHRLRSSRPTRQPPEHADSLSSGEDDDDDGFELLTAENLFSTLLSRVRSLTQRLNVDDNRASGFPSGRLLGRLGSNSSQGFWGLHEPLSRRLSEAQFRRSMSRDTDRFGKRDSAVPSNSATPSSPGARSTPSRESIFEMGSSNTLPRDRKAREETEREDAELLRRKSTRDATLECNFTPSLARRLSRQFIEQTRQSLPRSPSIPREKLYGGGSRDDDDERKSRRYGATVSDQTEYRSRSCDRGVVRRANSLLDGNERIARIDPRSPRRSVSLFDDDDDDDGGGGGGDDGNETVSSSSSSLPRQMTTLGRKYREGGKSALTGHYHNYRNEKIQEEPQDDRATNNSGSSVAEEASTRDFENRLLAAENLIRESKARNLWAGSYEESSRRDDESTSSSTMDFLVDNSTKRRSCIPSLRLRSGSLTREATTTSSERRNTISCGKENNDRGVTPERSLLGKLFRGGSANGGGGKSEQEAKAPKASKGPRRISRFLRPDFFDTPREESQYVKDKEAQKAAENERRKSRFMRKKPEIRVTSGEADDDNDDERITKTEEKPEKELKNEANTMTRDKTEISNKTEVEDASATTNGPRIERQSSKSTFLQSLERKLEKFRSGDESAKLTNGSCANGGERERASRETSAPLLETTENLLEASDSRSEESNATSASKSRVSSVLGLFKNDSSKIGANGQRSQSTILSKFKRNPYKGSRSDGVLSVEQSPSTSGSKIPTKFAKIDIRSKKTPEMNKKSPEKTTTETKKSPSKERSPTEKSGSRKSLDKPARITKKSSPEKSIEGKQDKPEKSSSAKDEPPKKSENKVAARSSTRKLSADKITDNKQTEARNNDAEEKKNVVRAKKSVKTLGGLVKNGSVGKLETRDKSTEEMDKRIVGKAAKPKETTDKDATDATRKKKIVRIVKKIGKSSENSDVKPDDKDSPRKTLMKKITSGTKKDTSPENSTKKTKEKSPEIPVKKMEDKRQDAGTITDEKTPDGMIRINETTVDKKASSSVAKISSSQALAVPEGSSASAGSPGKDAESNKNGAALGASKSNKVNLKLDLTKIPQHTFKSVGSTKPKDAPKPESSSSRSILGRTMATGDSPKSHDADSSSTATHRDEAPPSRDVESLRRETISPEIPKNARNARCSPRKTEMVTRELEEIEEDERINEKQSSTARPTTLSLEQKIANPQRSARAISNDRTDDMFSPLDDAESFDSWSICSADLNHHRHDFNSPTSPSYSPISRIDNSESIIDRIRRKSFYSRFNERKRKSSLNASSSSVGLPMSSTLPRKFSFNCSRDKYDYKKPNIYSGTSRRSLERSCSLYDDDDATLHRVKSSSERGRHYSDSIGNLPTESKGSNDRYASLGACYDSLRRYRVTPSPESSAMQRRYLSTDYGLDNDGGAYKSPTSSSSFHNDSSLDSYTSRDTLPRKYGSVSSCPETKTADYYEELLTPSRSDYLTLRKTPLANDYHTRNENGYHNDSFNVHREAGSDRWKNHSDRIAGIDFTGDDDGRLDKQIRSNAEKANGSQNRSVSGAEQDAEASKVE